MQTILQYYIIMSDDEEQDTKIEGQEGEESDTKANNEAWQTVCRTSAKQNVYLLEHEQWTDCVFLVGENSTDAKRFAAHKMLLSKASAVFAAMFYGPLAENKEIRITDISASIFQILLHFIYTEDVVVTCNRQLPAVFYAAQKYMLEALQDKCVVNMKKALSPATACWLYENSTLVQSTSLKENSWKVMVERTEEVLKEESFSEALYDTVLDLVKCETLHLMSEEPLIAACLKWVNAEAERQDLPISRDGLREALGEIFQLLRLLTLTPLQFIKGELLTCELLSAKDKNLIQIKLKTPDDESLDIPSDVCTKIVKRYTTPIDIPEVDFLKSISHSVNQGFVAYSSFSFSCDVTVYGIVVANDISNICMLFQYTYKCPPFDIGPIINEPRNQGTTYDLKFTNPIPIKQGESYRITISSGSSVCKPGKMELIIGKNIYKDMSVANNPDNSIIMGILFKKS